jgi:outer membrane protein assembly factor BamB
MNRCRISILIAWLVISSETLTVCAVEDWNQFRGPNSNGHADAKNIPTEFGENKNIKWKIAVPGRGWSSPVVEGNQIWITTAIEKEATGEERKAMLKKATTGGMSAFSSVDLRAVCFDLSSGKKIHDIELFNLSDPPLINSLNSFASPTPLIEGDFVFLSFGSFGTACVERKSGKVIWKNKKHQIDHQTGPGSSPILYKDLLIINFDGTDDQYVAAINKQTGKDAWQARRTGKLDPRGDMKKAFATPLIAKVGDEDQLISPGADWVYGYNPQTGVELWKIKFGQLGFSNAPQPVVVDGTLFICTGFMKSRMLAIKLGSGRPADEDVIWDFRSQVPAMSTPIAVGGNLYFASDRGIATCIDAKTGGQNWQTRLSGDVSASPIYCDGHLLFSNRKGQVFVVKPGEEFNLVATNQLDSRVMATPAASGESLLVRTEKSLYHFGK